VAIDDFFKKVVHMKNVRKITLLAVLVMLFVSCSTEVEQRRPTDEFANKVPEVVIIEEPSTSNSHENGVNFANSFIPSYFLDLEIDPLNRWVSGVLRVEFVNTSRSNLSRVYFRVPENVEITGVNVDSHQSDFYQGNDFLRLYLENFLAPEGTLDISLVFEGRVAHASTPVGASGNALWFGGFVPMLAMLTADGSSPNLNVTWASNFLVNIVTPSDYTVAATGGVASVQGADFASHSADAMLVRDFAFVVMSENYNTRSIATAEGVSVVLHYNTRMEHDVSALDAVLENAYAALMHFDRLIAPSPQNRLELVEVSLSEGLQSFPGIIFVDTGLLRMHETQFYMVRGIAQQWFGNVLGANSAAEPWLTYGLTEFLALDFILTRAELSENMMEVVEGENVRDRSVLLFYVLQREMGINVFEEFLQAYYNRQAFGIATTADLIAVAEEFGIRADLIREIMP